MSPTSRATWLNPTKLARCAMYLCYTTFGIAVGLNRSSRCLLQRFGRCALCSVAVDHKSSYNPHSTSTKDRETFYWQVSASTRTRESFYERFSKGMLDLPLVRAFIFSIVAGRFG